MQEDLRQTHVELDRHLTLLLLLVMSQQPPSLQQNDDHPPSLPPVSSDGAEVYLAEIAACQLAALRNVVAVHRGAATRNNAVAVADALARVDAADVTRMLPATEALILAGHARMLDDAARGHDAHLLRRCQQSRHGAAAVD
jgi:hypothetical protein